MGEEQRQDSAPPGPRAEPQREYGGGLGGADKPAAELLDEAFRAHQEGRLAAAAQLYQDLLTVDPDNADGWHLLGLVMRQTGQADRAIALIRRAIALRSDCAVYHNNLGSTLLDSGNAADAVPCFERALALDSRYVQAHYNLGLALQTLERHAEAESCYRQALALDSNLPKALMNLGVIAARNENPKEAVDFYRKAIALDPAHPAIHNNLGITLLHMGRLDEARQQFETAIGLAPKKAEYFLNLVQTVRLPPGHPQLLALQSLAEEEDSLSIPDRIALHFALGKAYGDAGEQERSFGHLLRGNRLKRQQVTYNEEATLGVHDRVRGVFTRELLERSKDLGDASPLPVFVIGMPRSGTTLVEQILSSHPKVHGAGEIRDLEDAIGSASPMAAWDNPELVAGWRDEFAAVGAAYVASLRRRAPAAERIVDKLLGNFLHVGMIRLALPNARIVHVLRDPVDTCLSCFSQLFAESLEYSYDLGELGRYYSSYRKLMDHWRSILPPGIMLEIRYEELVGDLEGHSRAILAHCGLEWHAACLEFHKTERAVSTASTSQVRRPIYQTSVGRAAAYRHLLQPLLSALAGS